MGLARRQWYVDNSGSAIRMRRIVRPCHRGVTAMEADLLYYRRRLAEERMAADLAFDFRVRTIHLELAQAYAERVTALEAEQLGVRLRLIPAA